MRNVRRRLILIAVAAPECLTAHNAPFVVAALAPDIEVHAPVPLPLPQGDTTGIEMARVDRRGGVSEG